MVAVKVEGTEEFRRLAVQLKQAGRGDLRRELARAMREAAAPVVQDAQSRVQSLSVTGASGGASARAARAATALGRRKATDRAKNRAHARAGLRATIARSVRARVSTSGTSANVRIHLNKNVLPPDQRTLPGHLNEGRWKHPVFGNRDIWVAQSAPPAWFDDAMRSGGPRIRQEAFDVVERFIDKLE
ncbi:hypothetical protein JOF56_005710 [Kibdelosporangium banguiense]|uniref:HK97 gp10 family phage protein n=1 Tax=Kibdelosporangium banguiense TaxID=1365924 RepID=A0ABS4TMX9_9PSEU|nr:hypothetical protein [Kibdelosporangium banguiense]MBP2325325.1 hypothetical protein [Kibdelosporangium banguiense]